MTDSAGSSTARIVREWQFPLYVGGIEEKVQPVLLGGPYDDIDDALDCCWDWMCDRRALGARTYQSVFLIEMGGSVPVIRTLPKGALPSDDDEEPFD